MKEHFHARDDGEHVTPHTKHPWVINQGATAAGDGCSDANQLHGDHVVGEDVYGIHWSAGVLFPPVMGTIGEDKDGEREEEENVGEGEGCEDGGTRCVIEADVEEGVAGGVGGREGAILGGRLGVHFHGPKKVVRTQRRKKRGHINWGGGQR